MEKKGITQDKVVYFINNILLLIFAVIVLYPLIYVVSCSFSSGDALMGGKVRLLPEMCLRDSTEAVPGTERYGQHHRHDHPRPGRCPVREANCPHRGRTVAGVKDAPFSSLRVSDAYSKIVHRKSRTKISF